MSKNVLIRGYGDIGYPTICTYQVRAREAEAIAIIEEYLRTQTECKPERYLFEIRTEDDSRHLFSYRNDEIFNRETPEE